MPQSVEAVNAKALIPSAEYFGVSVENYISSAPDIGMQTILIAHTGLVIANAADRVRSRLLLPSDMFQGTYEESRRPPTTSDTSENTNAHSAQGIIPEHVEDFSKEHNIAPLVVARVGMKILAFAIVSGAGLGRDLSVYKGRTADKKGKLDSHLAFSISPLNTIIMNRKKHTKLTAFKRG